MNDPGHPLARLFSIRAADLLTGASADVLRARLSAWLIGSEVGSMSGQWTGEDIVLSGAGDLTELYRSALAAGGAAAGITDAADLTLKGLFAAHAAMEEKLGP